MDSNKRSLNIRKHFFETTLQFPPLHVEMGDDIKYLSGKILNAGSGYWRSIDQYVNGKVINQDIFEHPKIDIVSPLDKIPVDDFYFDSVLCNAVLEHVSNPKDVIDEIYRVTKKGGFFYLCVPFMQPEHLCPTDFQRYTLDGLKKIVSDAGFQIIKADGSGLNVYHTLAWIIQEWLYSKKSIKYYMLRALFFPILRRKARTSKHYVHTIASAYRIISQKPN